MLLVYIFISHDLHRYFTEIALLECVLTFFKVVEMVLLVYCFISHGLLSFDTTEIALFEYVLTFF